MIESLIRNMPSATLGALVQDIVANKTPEDVGNALKADLFSTTLASTASQRSVVEAVASLLAGRYERRSLAAVNRAIGTDMSAEEIAAALEGSNFEIVTGRRGEYVTTKNVAEAVLATFDGTEYTRRSVARVSALTGISEATILANAGEEYTVSPGRSGVQYVQEA